ncbi:MAG: NUDIX hydrolase [Chloroflexota bacterium]|nr:NUDIX hydrolase [Chloroflexota bacterium]
MPTLGLDVVVVEAGRVVLTRREDLGIWCLPGGGVDAGESVTHAAIREVREETGLDVHLTQVVGIYSRPRWHGGGDHMVVFAAERISCRFGAPAVGKEG